MKSITLLFSVSFILIANVLHAGNPVKTQQFINHSEWIPSGKDWSFVENKGQLANQSDIKYYGHQGGVYLYCKPGMVSFVFTKVEKDEGAVSEATGSRVETQCLRLNDASATPNMPLPRDAFSASLQGKISTSLIDLILLGSNPHAQITATDKQEYYENYYTTGDADHGITNVHTYKTVTYKSIYPYIDMVLQTRDQGVEYSFIVHPGGKVTDIQLQWNGTQATKALANGGVKFRNSLGTIEESAPKSFMDGREVKSSLLKKGNGYCFKIAEYDKNKDLIIDPVLSWATYFGGKDDSPTGVSTDGSGNVYCSGYTEATSGVATSGAYQTSFGGGSSSSGPVFDAYLAKFSSSGSLLWATYFGGSGQDQATAVSTDGAGYVYLTGLTESSSGIATSGAYQTSMASKVTTPANAFLAKFSSAGALSWATYFGGSENESAAAVSTDTSGNVYIAGSATSTSGIATSGAYQTSMTGNYGNAFLAKFKSSGSIIWATYFGGNNSEGAQGISIDKYDNIYITGVTESDSGLATSGAYQTSLTAKGVPARNAFLAKFSSAGVLSWATYYGGSVQENASGVGTDGSGNVYITGGTKSSGGIATSGANQTSFGGSSDAFLAKFSSTGAISWSTYYGGSSDDAANGISVDGSGNVYITGVTQSNSGMVTTGAYQTALAGYDAFLAKFSPAGKLSWGTYYGGSGDEEGYGLSADGYGNIFVILITNSIGLATSGAYQTSFSGIDNNFLAKFSFQYKNDAGLVSVKTPSGTICPGSQQVKVILKNYGTTTLTSDSIYWKVNGIAQTPIKWTGSLYTDSNAFVSLGTYNFSSGINTIVAWSAKSNGLKDSSQGNDTAKIGFAANFPAAAVISDTTICSGYAISIGAKAVAGSSYVWSSSVSGFTSTSSNPSVSPTSITSYTLTETNSGGCVSSNSVTITVSTIPKAVISNTAICSGVAISIGATAVAGSSYAWFALGSGFTSTSSNPSVMPTSTTIYSLKETNSSGCFKFDSVIITVNALPAAAVISNTSICSGSSISIGASAVTGSNYSWTSSPSGFPSSLSNPSVSPTSTTSYTLTETNSNGCSVTDTVTITVISIPASAAISNTGICSGTSISIGNTTVPGNTYLWMSSSSGFTSSSSNPSVSPASTTKYKLIETIRKGCSGTDSVTITVNPLPKSNFSFTTVCPGDSTPFKDSSTLAASYNWYFGDGGTSLLSSPKHLYSSIGNYTVSLKVTSSGGCTDSTSKALSLSSCVWPGDANDDKVVDMKDLLAIGIAYGTVGHLRPNASINWTAQPSPDWDSIFDNGANYKNADCNGDSIVNYKDTLAVSANYSLSHSKSGGLNQGSASDPGFNIKYLKDTFYAGDTLIAQIILGSNTKPITNLYGLTFSLAFDPALFETNKAFLKINSSFLGTNGTDLIDMTKNNTSPDTIDIGICRINQLNASGNGTIAALYLPVNPSLPKKYLKANLAISNNFQISYNQKPVPLYLTSDSILVKQDHTGIDNPKINEAFSFSIFPNPFQATTTITYNLKHKSEINIVLIDMTGKQIGTIVNENQISGNYQFDINAEKYHLNPGIYIMKFMMDDEVVSRRLVKF